MNADPIIEIVTAIIERASELIEQKNPTGKSLKQACDEMRVYARKNKGKKAHNIRLP